MLRRNSPQEMKASTGPFLLGLGLALSLFLGGAIRTFLGPAQVRQFIENELASRRTKFDLDFFEARLSLAKGWWPRLGLELQEVVLQAKSKCDTSLRLEVESVYIPIYLWKLFHQKLKFKTIQFTQVNLSSRPLGDLSFCEPSLTASTVRRRSKETPREADSLKAQASTTTPGENKIFDDFMEQFNRFIVTRWSKELKNTSRWLDGIEIEKFVVKGVLPRNIDVYFQDIELSIDPTGSSADLVLKAKPASSSVYFLPLETFYLDLKVTPERLHSLVSTGFKEGEWKLDGKLNLQSMQLDVGSALDTFPLSEILPGLSKSGLIKAVGDYPRSVWLSCRQRMNGSLLNWRDLGISTSGCEISGDLGIMKLADHRTTPFSEGAAALDFLIRIRRFSVQNFLRGLGVSGPKGVLHRQGFLTGDLRVKALRDVRFEGFIEEFAVLFSRNGRRQIQEVDKAYGEILFRESRVSAKLTKASLKGGEFTGQVSVNVDQNFDEGVFQANISNLELDSPIESLLLDGGAIGSVELYGKGSFQSGKLSSWSGNLGISELSTRQIRLGEIKTSAEWKGDEMKGKLSVGSLSFGALQPLYGLFFPLYLNELKRGDEIVWKKVKAVYEFEPGRVEWRKSVSMDSKKDIQFISNGSWKEAEGLSGSIGVKFPSMNLLSWSLTGTKLKPLLVPSDGVLKELAPQLPAYKEPIKVELKSSSDLFGKITELSKNLNFKTIKETVVDSAKRLIPSTEAQSVQD